MAVGQGSDYGRVVIVAYAAAHSVAPTTYAAARLGPRYDCTTVPAPTWDGNSKRDGLM